MKKSLIAVAFGLAVSSTTFAGQADNFIKNYEDEATKILAIMKQELMVEQEIQMVRSELEQAVENLQVSQLERVYKGEVLNDTSKKSLPVESKKILATVTKKSS